MKLSIYLNRRVFVMLHFNSLPYLSFTWSKSLLLPFYVFERTALSVLGLHPFILRKVIAESSVYLWFSGVESGNFRNVRASNTQIWHAYNCYRCSFGEEYFFFFFFFFILEVSFEWLFMGCINLLSSFIPFYLWHG